MLNRRVDRRRETSRDGDDFIAGLEAAFAQLVACEARQRQQVRRRTRRGRQHEGRSNDPTELGFKLGIEASRGQPTVERSLDHQLDLRGADHLAGWRDDALARYEGLRRKLGFGVLGDQWHEFACGGRQRS